MSILVFYGLKLTATRATIVWGEGPVSFTLLKDAVTSTYMELNKQHKNRLHPKICCPEVISVTLNVFPGCTNIACGRPVLVIPDQPSTSCQLCHTTVKVSKCPCISHCKRHGKAANLPLKVLRSYLQQDVIKLYSKEHIKSFQDSPLFMEKLDYFYNTKNVITHMKKHWPTLLSSLDFTYKIYFLETYYI